MPWVDEDTCYGCGDCLETCPVEAITLSGHVAFVDQDLCICCGRCLDSCANNSLREEEARIQALVAANVEFTEFCLEACARNFDGDPAVKAACLQRLLNRFEQEKTVAELTLERLRHLYQA